MTLRKIPVAGADLSGDEERYVVDAIRSTWFPSTGYNFRMTNAQAAMLCAQLEHRDAIIGQRRKVF